MVTALVQMPLQTPLTRDEAKKIFTVTAPKYREAEGLLRKYYILSEDGQTAGGVYLWQSRADAEKVYSDQWKQFIESKYGSPPRIIFFETPVLVDNTTGEIIAD